MLALTMAASRRPRVAVCFAATAKNSNVRSYEQTPMARLSIPSTKRTASQARIYVGIDDDDTLMMTWKEKIEHDATVIVTPGRKNHIPFNEITRKAYDDGADYIVRINDDTEFITEGWVKLGIQALQSMKPPNVGVVAPVCKQNTAIFTHDMVHRTHLNIFDVYYPVIFDNWYVDTWITQVYQPDRSKLVKDWEVRHHLAKTRYQVDQKQRRNLADEVERGKTKITKWVNKRTEATTSVDCKKYFPMRLSSALENDLTKLLSWIRERLAPAGIDFTIACGTALGYARTQSMLPWDDDIDIAISANEMKRAQQLITDPETGFCTANLWLGFKVFFCKSPKIGKYAWGYPLIDVFSTKESGGGGIKKDTMFPSKPGVLLGVDVGTPHNLPEHLKARYKEQDAINNCYSQHYNHSTESQITDRKKYPCVDVYKQCYGIDLKGQEKRQARSAVDAKKRVVSYSLYGANPRYTDGAVANADLAPSIYPGWEMWIYHDESVPDAVLSDLRTRSWVKLINMQNHPIIKNQMVWRFLVSSSSMAERYIIRDIDSRLSMREKEAVDEWIKSGARFHVMRDHPSHSRFAMSGGMWGGTMDAVPDMETRLTQRRKMNRDYLQDMNFLNDVIWPIAQKSVMQHDSFSCDKFGGGRPFPTRRIGWEHVGSVYIDGKMRQGDVNILKRAREAEKCTTYSHPGSVFSVNKLVTNKQYIRMCDAAFRTRSRDDLNPSLLKPNSIICVRGETAILSRFFKLNINVPFVLVTIESDESVPQNKQWLNNGHLKKWYSWNSHHKDVIPIPIGLNEDTQLQPMRQAIPAPTKIEKALVNFKRSRSERIFLHDKVKDLPFVHTESYSKKWNDAQELRAHYETISKYKWTLCPRGAGQDTHRLWEALYLGSIPVVLKSSISALYHGLPVIQLNSWDELSLSTLKERSKSLPADRTTAYFEHWESKIRGLLPSSKLVDTNGATPLVLYYMHIPTGARCRHPNGLAPLVCVVTTRSDDPALIYVSVQDNWRSLGRRALAAFPKLRSFPAEWYFKVDQDTFVWRERLEQRLSAVPSEVKYVGQVFSFKGSANYASGGAGYGIRRGALLKIEPTRCRLIPNQQTNYEDVVVGDCLKRHGVSVYQLDGLYGDTQPGDVKTFPNHVFPHNHTATVLTVHKYKPHSKYSNKPKGP